MAFRLVVVALVIAQCLGKMRLGRSFPKIDEHGMQLANEYQVIHPENVVRGSNKYVDGVDFKIDSISPLNINNDEIVTVSFTAKVPTGKDWIGAYSPSDVDITKTVPGMENYLYHL